MKSKGIIIFIIMFSVCMVALVLLCMIFSGGIGSGLSDYAIKLSGRYEFWRVNSKSKVIGVRETEYGLSGDGKSSIPTEVLEFDFNDTHIIAKQVEYVKQYEGDLFGSPDYNKIYYWIIVVDEEISYGPFSLDEFNIKRKEMNISEKLNLKSPNEFEKNY